MSEPAPLSRFKHFQRPSGHWLSKASFPLNDEGEINKAHALHFIVKAAFGGNTTVPILDVLEAESGSVDGSNETQPHVLDIGCGPGIWVMEMSTDYPRSQFTGIDNDSYNFPTQTMPRNAHFEAVDIDANTTLPFPDAEFTFVHIDGMGTAFTEEQWTGVLAEVSRTLKPGGWLEVIGSTTPFVNIGPATERFLKAVQANLIESYRDPLCILSLPEKLRSLPSFSSVSIQQADVPVGRRHGGELGALCMENLAHVTRELKEWMSETALLSQEADSERQNRNLEITEVFQEFEEYGTIMPYYVVVARRS